MHLTQTCIGTIALRAVINLVINTGIQRAKEVEIGRPDIPDHPSLPMPQPNLLFAFGLFSDHLSQSGIFGQPQSQFEPSVPLDA